MKKPNWKAQANHSCESIRDSNFDFLLVLRWIYKVRNKDQYLIWISKRKDLLQNLELPRQKIKSKHDNNIEVPKRQK